MINYLTYLTTIFNDAAQPWQLGFQDSAAPGFTGIVTLHNTIGFYLIVISFAVFWVMMSIIYYYSSSKNLIAYKYLTHGTVLELIWTITPALILIAIAFPSFRLLYLMDEVISPTLTIKVVGHQWYWSYEYSDFITDSGDSIDFDSYMIPESDLELGQFRLLDVDNRLIIPVDCHIRLNQVSFLAERSGTFYGQCSEICGVWHGFMPIVVEAVSSPDFIVWLDSASS